MCARKRPVTTGDARAARLLRDRVDERLGELGRRRRGPRRPPPLARVAEQRELRDDAERAARLEQARGSCGPPRRARTRRCTSFCASARAASGPSPRATPTSARRPAPISATVSPADADARLRGRAARRRARRSGHEAAPDPRSGRGTRRCPSVRSSTIWQMRTPGWSSSGWPATLLISSTWRFETPGCTKADVTWIMRPRRAKRLRPSRKPQRSGASVMRSRVMPWTVAPGGSTYGRRTRCAACSGGSRRPRVIGIGAGPGSSTRSSSPSVRSIDAGPTASGENGSMRSRPDSSSARIAVARQDRHGGAHDTVARVRHPFFDLPRPIVIGHRGSSGEAPENTLPAFERALEQGAAILETDVHATARRRGRDLPRRARRPHDRRRGRDRGARLRRAPPPRRRLRLHAGRRRARSRSAAAGMRIATLAEAFEAFPEARFNIEIKRDDAGARGRRARARSRTPGARSARSSPRATTARWRGCGGACAETGLAPAVGASRRRRARLRARGARGQRAAARADGAPDPRRASAAARS